MHVIPSGVALLGPGGASVRAGVDQPKPRIAEPANARQEPIWGLGVWCECIHSGRLTCMLRWQGDGIFGEGAAVVAGNPHSRRQGRA